MGMAPPGLLGSARRCQSYGVRRKHPIRPWQRGRTQLPSSVGHESKCWLWFYSVLSLALALPQGSIRAGAQCCDLRLRSAAGARPDSDRTGPLGALPMRLLRSGRSGDHSQASRVWSMAARGAVRLGGGVHCHGDSAPCAHAACSGPMIRTSCHAQACLLGTAAKYHHQPEAAPLAPRGRWAQSPGPASCVARAGGHATFKIRRLPHRNLAVPPARGAEDADAAASSAP